MMIYVNGQDIARLALGCLENDNWTKSPEVLDIRPEQYLAGLEAFLRQAGIERQAITGFVLVKGPGSATSLRTSHALVNTLAFALQVKIISVEKAPEVPNHDILSLLAGQPLVDQALPTYAHTPNITKTNRDALKRKTI